jgi:hypothetical protein
MVQKTTLPLIVLGNSMNGDPPMTTDPKITVELEAETGEKFVVSFSMRGILSTVMMILNWAPLKEELAHVEPPIKY